MFFTCFTGFFTTISLHLYRVLIKIFRFKTSQHDLSPKKLVTLLSAAVIDQCISRLKNPNSGAENFSLTLCKKTCLSFEFLHWLCPANWFFVLHLSCLYTLVSLINEQALINKQDGKTLEFY